MYSTTSRTFISRKHENSTCLVSVRSKYLLSHLVYCSLLATQTLIAIIMAVILLSFYYLCIGFRIRDGSNKTTPPKKPSQQNDIVLKPIEY